MGSVRGSDIVAPPSLVLTKIRFLICAPKGTPLAPLLALRLTEQTTGCGDVHPSARPQGC